MRFGINSLPHEFSFHELSNLDNGLYHRIIYYHFFKKSEYVFIPLNSKCFFFFPLGAHLWKGFHGPAVLSNVSFPELGHVDAAFRMHNLEKKDDHDHIYFFLV